MSEKDFNLLFAKNLKYYLSVNDMTQLELAEKMEVSATSVSNWCKGTKVPRMDKVDKICNLLGLKRSDLMTDHPIGVQSVSYYLNSETAQIAQKIFENRELSLLFDAAKDAKPEDLETVHAMLLALKRKENHED